MKKSLLFFSFLICMLNLYPQVKLEVTELNVSNIKPNLDDQIFTEEETDGPFVYLKCTIFNESDTSIILLPSQASIEINFNHRGSVFHQLVFAMSFAENDSLLVKSKDTAVFEIGTQILLGSPLWSQSETDYSMILLEVLPTLRVKYTDAHLRLFSIRIHSVNVK